MKRILAACLAAGLLAPMLPAARAHAQAAVPFEPVPLERPAERPHRSAWLCVAAGAGLVGASLVLADRADDAYDQYLRSTDPPAISRLYDRTVRYDRLSAGALLAGEALVATGIWLRFLRRPPPARVALVVEPDRCALSLRF